MAVDRLRQGYGVSAKASAAAERPPAIASIPANSRSLLTPQAHARTARLRLRTFVGDVNAKTRQALLGRAGLAGAPTLGSHDSGPAPAYARRASLCR